MPQRIIIVNPFGIGDVVFSTPVVENVKAAYPDAFIAYLCNARTAPIFRDNPHIDKVFIYEKDDWRRLWRRSRIRCIIDFLRFLREIKRCRFDLSIDLSLGRHYSFFLWLLGVGKRYGLNYKNRGLFLTRKIDIRGYEDKHVIEYYLDLLRFMGLNPRQVRPRVYIKEEHRAWAREFLKAKGLDVSAPSSGDMNSAPRLVGIIPGGGITWGRDVEARRWPRERFARLADEIIRQCRATVLIFGDRSEKGLCRDVCAAMDNKPIAIVGETTLSQFIALLSCCSLVVANDGGPLHLSVALGARTVSIFGPVDERVYGQYPPDPNRHRVVKKALPCRPCYNRFRKPPCYYHRRCLRNITVAEALIDVFDLLGK
ncbi:MAG: glycosyltransferase family 9 protein [Candidatus Omnitrophota bacterium]